MTSPNAGIRQILNPADPVHAPAPTAAPATSSGDAQGITNITPDGVKAVGVVVSALAAEVTVICQPAGDDARAAAAGLSGWGTQNALNYVADKFDHQSAALLQALFTSANLLAESASSYTAADNAAAGQAGG